MMNKNLRPSLNCSPAAVQARVYSAYSNLCLKGLISTIVIACASCNRSNYVRISDNSFRNISDEIASADTRFESLTPDNACSRLAYLRSLQRGRSLFLCDLQTLESKVIPTSNEVSRIFGWSTDGRFLAFSQVSATKPNAKNLAIANSNESWVSIFDSDKNSIERLTTNSLVVESSFVWLTNHTYFFISKSITQGTVDKFVGDWNNRTKTNVFNYIYDFILTTNTTVAFLKYGNILKCQLDGPANQSIVHLSHFDADKFDVIKWLHYSPITGKYLFCGRPESSNWRYLFDFDPDGERLNQLSHEDTYNGQWIDNGEGYAYVANDFNHFSLAIRPLTSAGNTNLFVLGQVITYTAPPSGERLFIEAAERFEPASIWEYDLKKRSLHRVVAGQERPFAVSHLLEPKELKVKTTSGRLVPCFILNPGDSGSKSIAVKHPLVVYLPPSGWQFQRGFEAQSQLFANLGFYFLAVNYTGCDGYGREHAIQDRSAADEDVLTAYNWVLQNEQIDTRNVFLLSASSGSVVASSLLATKSSLWRGAAFNYPAGLPDPESDLHALPPLLIVTGDQDQFLPIVSRFELKMSDIGRNEIFLIQTNSAHLHWRLDDIRQVRDEVAHFFLEQLR